MKQEFVKVNNAATEQKSQTDAIKLIDDILDEDNPFNNVDSEDIWREDDIFDNDNTQAIKNISKEIIDVAESIETITVTDDNDEFNPIEIIAIEDNIDIPSDDGIATDATKKVKIITTNSNQLRLASNRMEKKYLRQKSRGILKKANKKAADWLTKARFLGTDDLETINYDNDTNINDLDNANLKKTSGAQIAAKKIVKNIEIWQEKNLTGHHNKILLMILLI